MNVSVSLEDIQLFIFKGSVAERSKLPAHFSAYQCWQETWEQVYQQEMKINHLLYSDDFTRQDYIIGLFLGERCVGTAFMRLAHLDSQISRKDSFFRFWPEETINQATILAKGLPIVLATYFTICPEFRQSFGGVCWKSLLLSLYLKKFKTLDTSIMITAARKIRSNEKLCHSYGASLLCPDIPYLINGHPIPGEVADLIYWNKTEAGKRADHQEFLVQKVWQNRNEDQEINLTGVKHAA